MDFLEWQRLRIPSSEVVVESGVPSMATENFLPVTHLRRERQQRMPYFDLKHSWTTLVTR